MSILNNAVESIQIGMEDFHDDDHRRVLSAIRNLYAGILLLFKYKLQQLSPDGSDEVLLKVKILPLASLDTGEIEWTGKGKKTVDFQDITERLRSLGVTEIEWGRLEQLQRIRNDIEHYYSPLPAERMKEAVASALHLIMQFCEPHLQRTPIEILGEQCWGQMLDVASVYDAELKACREKLEAIDWPFDEVLESVPYMRCPECDSALLRLYDSSVQDKEKVFTCSTCNKDSTYASVIGVAVSESQSGANHWSIRKGGDLVTESCPECEADAYLCAYDQCAACFYVPDNIACKWCEERLDTSEQWEGVCSYCQHKYEKLMAE
ncbi:hypothetical protein [Pseudomonas atacamensis]|uniref:hypothetical protein n=1 Tax=Pseudomonas atacamensis TaxID=2565368 RepID=UPI00244C6742|nr:hypothetical protein [Pseudomonas atacamensis]MDH2076886.1 hypothetical protein [Pseudomonas atacamensis]